MWKLSAAAGCVMLFANLLEPRTADASTYMVGFQIGELVTGTITTSCDNCLLDPTNIVSWSFAINNTLGFSSSDDPSALTYTNAGAGKASPGLTSPLSASGGTIVYDPFPADGFIGFCSDASCNLSLVFLPNSVEYVASKGGSGAIVASSAHLTTPYTIACDAACAPTTLPFVSDVPEPSTWAMMLLGFAGLGFMAYRRRDAIMAT